MNNMKTRFITITVFNAQMPKAQEKVEELVCCLKKGRSFGTFVGEQQGDEVSRWNSSTSRP
jgi:hypothetical protein